MMSNEHWTDRLSEYVDGELRAAERAACEAHLSRCPECAGTLEELRAVVAQASLLPELPPERDLWPEIEARLPVRGVPGVPGDRTVVSLHARRRSVVLTIPQLAAAAIALVLFSVGGAWVTLAGGAGTVSGTPGTAGVDAAAGGGGGAGGVAPQVAFAASYRDAISQLEVEFERRRAELDPETIRVVEENLAIIDAAIVEAGRALAEEPASGFLSTRLADAMRQKVDLLRQVTTIDRIES